MWAAAAVLEGTVITMTDNAAKSAARKHQRDTGVSYTRALRHVANAHTTPAADRLVGRGWYFADLGHAILCAADNLGDARIASNKAYYIPNVTAEVNDCCGRISSDIANASLLLRNAREQLRAASTAFADSSGKDDVLIPAPQVTFSERYGDSPHGVLADSSQPAVRDVLAVLDGVPYQAWVDRFGPSNSNGGTAWVLRTTAGPATIYRTESGTEEGNSISGTTTWNIGAHADRVIWHLECTLTPDVPFETRERISSVDAPNGGFNVLSEITYALDEASHDLRDVTQWLESDWTPAGTELPAGAAATRISVAGLIERVQTIVDEASELARPLLEGYRSP